MDAIFSFEMGALSENRGLFGSLASGGLKMVRPFHHSLGHRDS